MEILEVYENFSGLIVEVIPVRSRSSLYIPNDVELHNTLMPSDRCKIFIISQRRTGRSQQVMYKLKISQHANMKLEEALVNVLSIGLHHSYDGSE